MCPTHVRGGGLVGMLDVPRLELTTPVVEGDDEGISKKAAGHLPDTPMPWRKATAPWPPIAMAYSGR